MRDIVADLDLINEALGDCEATPFMRKIVLAIYECSGLSNALACARAWSRKVR